MTKFRDFFRMRIFRYIAAAIAVVVSAAVIFLILSNFRTEPTTHTVIKTNGEEIAEENSEAQSETVYFSKFGEKYHIKSKCGGKEFFPCSLEDAKDMGLEICKICSKNNQE